MTLSSRLALDVFNLDLGLAWDRLRSEIFYSGLGLSESGFLLLCFPASPLPRVPPLPLCPASVFLPSVPLSCFDAFPISMFLLSCFVAFQNCSSPASVLCTPLVFFAFLRIQYCASYFFMVVCFLLPHKVSSGNPATNARRSVCSQKIQNTMHIASC